MLYKRQIYEIPMTDRSFITTADYTPFDVRMPADISRDPDVAAVLDANEMITVYNLNQAKNSVYGQGLVDRSANENRSLYTGVEASFSARLPGGAMMFGSWTAEKNVSVFCESDDNPNGPPTGRPVSGAQRRAGRPLLRSARSSTCRSCTSSSWRATTGCRSASTSAPSCRASAASSASFTWQPAASLFPNGQRTQSQTIILNEPGSLFGERWDQLDVNFKKNFRYGNKVHTFQIDIFNVFNNNSIRTMNDTVGNIARPGDGDHAGPVPATRRISSSGNVRRCKRRTKTKNE